MNYLAKLTKDEVCYICSVIPLQETVMYFKHYPKDFAKVMPGFRATSLKSQEQVSALLFRNLNRPFISSFIEKHISDWLSQIQKHIKKCLNDGDNKESALIHTLPFCFFVDNIGIYFKLVDEEYPKEYITLLSASIKSIKSLDTKREKLKAGLNEKDSEIQRMKAELKHIQSNLDKAEEKLSDRYAEIKALKRTNAELSKLKIIIQSNEQAIDNLKSKAQEHEEYVRQLKAELSAAKDDRQLIEVQIKEELEKHRIIKVAKQQTARKPKCPKDIDDFKEYLGYNLENIGVPTKAEYFSLLKEHLSDILFQGVPIIVGRSVGMTLIKCVSNALVGNSNVTTLVFKSEISEETIEEFLSTGERIVCLDNFIGNFNETILLTLCDKHKDKIIFLTVIYDRTLCFVPEEFMKYCYYLNLNRIEALTGNFDLTEDPSIVDEIETANMKVTPDSRWSSLLKELFGEFGVSKGLSEHKSALISNELNLCRLLAFDILPYCVDVLRIAPFNVSERFVKYAGDCSRCSYKNLFRRWFA